MTTIESFACQLTDEDLTRACAPEQPEAVEVGREWMRLSDGNVLSVKRVRGDFIDLGSESLTVILQSVALREEWVCIDAPDNVRPLSAEQEPENAKAAP